MEPVWRLSESIPLDEQFPLTESFTLASAADAFIWSDFLGDPLWLYRITDLTGRYAEGQRLSGRLIEGQKLSGQYVAVKRLEGDA